MNPLDRNELLRREIFKLTRLLKHNGFPVILAQVHGAGQDIYLIEQQIRLAEGFMSQMFYRHLQRILEKAKAIKSGVS